MTPQCGPDDLVPNQGFFVLSCMMYRTIRTPFLNGIQYDIKAYETLLNYCSNPTEAFTTHQSGNRLSIGCPLSVSAPPTIR